jgi:hypothetical protein
MAKSGDRDTLESGHAKGLIAVAMKKTQTSLTIGAPA